MQNCNIQITTFTQGTHSRVCVNGKLQHTSKGFIASYVQDGDAVTVQAEPNFFDMTRKGETELHAHFEKGVQSAFVIGFEGSEGKIPVFTNDYRFTQKGGYFITLDYLLGNEQRFRLKISILSISEEK